MSSWSLALASVLLAACGTSASIPPDAAAAVIGSFEGEVLADGTIRVWTPVQVPLSTGASASAIVELPETGTTNYVTVANVVGTVNLNVTNGCGAGVDATQADVRVTSHYASGNYLRNVYAQITRMDGTGISGCNSAQSFPSGSGLNNAKGLWSYAPINPGDFADATWKFNRPNGTSYRFGGKIYGEVVSQTVPTNVYIAITNPTGIAWTTNDLNMWVVGASTTSTMYRFLSSASPMVATSTYALTGFTSTLLPTAAVAGDANNSIIVVGADPAAHQSLIGRVSTSGGTWSKSSTLPNTEFAAVVNDSKDNVILAADRYGSTVHYYAASNLGETNGSPCTTAAPCNIGTNPVALVYTGDANVQGPTWVANFGSNDVTVLVPSSQGQFGFTGTKYSTGTGPVALAYDGSTYVWVANQTAFTVTRHLKGTPSSTTTFAVTNQPDDLALDGSGNVWVLSKAARVLTKLNSSGTQIGVYALTFQPTKIRYFNGYLWLGDASGSVLVRWTG